MQVTGYLPQTQIVQTQASSPAVLSSAESDLFANQRLLNAAASQLPITGAVMGFGNAPMTQAQIAMSIADGSGGAMPLLLTSSDLKLIKETTGQTVVPNPNGDSSPIIYDAQGKQVAESLATDELVGTLSWIRASGGSYSSTAPGNWTTITSSMDITAADLQGFKEEYAGKNSLAVNSDIIDQAISILNAQTANSKNA